MDKEKFERAKLITNEIEDLKSQLKSLEGSHWDKGVIIEVKTGYSDMGRDLHARANFDGVVGLAIGMDVRTIIENRINKLEDEFKSL